MSVRWLALLGALLVTPAPSMTVFTADSLTRIRPKDPVRPEAEARLKAARNEAEAFQVVVRAGEKPLPAVMVEVSDLQGDGGRVIGRAAVSLYREHYLDVRTPSPRSKDGAGAYPDPLIPILPPAARPPAKLPRFAGGPFAVLPDTNQPIWVEITVPKDAAAGDYQGTVTVACFGELSVAIPVKLTVWDFALPDVPSLRTNFGGLGRRLLTGHGGFKPDTPPYRALERRYAESMAAHRLCPPIPPYLRPKPGPDGTVDAKESHAGLKEWMETFHVTGFEIKLEGEDPAGKQRDYNVKLIQSTWAYLKQHGWEKLAYVPVLEEPKDQAGYDEVRKRAKLVHEAQPGCKVFCAKQPAPENPAWGTLVGSVDLWAPLWTLFDEASVAERQKAGDEVWSHTSMCQGKDGQDAPYWEIDFPLLNYRVPAWTSRRYGLRGLYYWTVVYWPAGDPWVNPLTYKNFNGEGVLFYPGADAGIDGPVASMRLKALRDGLEDYEYLVLAGDEGAAKASAIGRSWTQWETDPAKLAAAREELAAVILSKKK